MTKLTEGSIMCGLHPTPRAHGLAQVSVASVVAGLGKSSGGPTTGIVSLCEASAKAGVKSSLFSVRLAPGEPEHLPDPSLVDVHRIAGFYTKWLRLSWSPTLKRSLLRHCQECSVQVIHSHGLWTQPNLVAATVARQLKIPLVVSTHGMLAPWAWRYKVWKKRPVWWLWQRRSLASAAVFRATAQQEADALRAHGFQNPIAMIPNGVDTQTCPPVKRRSHEGFKTLLYLGRIHPVKGLLDLVAAFAQIRPVDWKVLICGPDESGYARVIRKAVAEAGLTDAFQFKPAIYGAEKDDLYAASNLFVLPSLSENFGIVVAEAMAAGLPVITTKGTPWAELEEHRCGWWVELGPEPLAAALRQAVELTDEQRSEMGLRGQSLVQRKYTWTAIGKEMRAVYDWIAGAQAKPPCIV